MLRRTQGFVDRSADSTEAASPRQGGDEGHERSKEVLVPEDALLRGGLHTGRTRKACAPTCAGYTPPKSDVERAFAQFGPIQYVWLRSGEDWMDPPVEKRRLGDFSYNYATVIFHSKPDATAACEALNGAALLGSKALMVRYATNTRADDMSDDDDNDGDDSDMHESDGMEDDEFDADDFF